MYKVKLFPLLRSDCFDTEEYKFRAGYNKVVQSFNTWQLSGRSETNEELLTEIAVLIVLFDDDDLLDHISDSAEENLLKMKELIEEANEDRG